ncbi:MAG: phosphocholine cytidylyltransferase family protein, partial [Clostridia bacterium]|nr:phosphocholine cytidylyltransferase family protein [Clostridia bacterium]
NNISSLYVAREHLSDCMILDGDQIIRLPEALDRHFTLSGYNAVWTEGHTNEWLLTVKDGHITGCSRTGGSRGWQLYSVSRWTAADGERLSRHLETEISLGHKDLYWDDVALFCYPEQYDLGIFEMEAGSVIEIDSYEELVAIDPSYSVLP